MLADKLFIIPIEKGKQAIQNLWNIVQKLAQDEYKQQTNQIMMPKIINGRIILTQPLKQNKNTSSSQHQKVDQQTQTPFKIVTTYKLRIKKSASTKKLDDPFKHELCQISTNQLKYGEIPYQKQRYHIKNKNSQSQLNLSQGFLEKQDQLKLLEEAKHKKNELMREMSQVQNQIQVLERKIVISEKNLKKVKPDDQQQKFVQNECIKLSFMKRIEQKNQITDRIEKLNMKKQYQKDQQQKAKEFIQQLNRRKIESKVVKELREFQNDQIKQNLYNYRDFEFCDFFKE